MSVIGLDSLVFIYVLNSDSQLHVAAVKTMRSIEDGTHQAVMSSLVLTEVMVHPIHSGDAEYIQRAQSLVSQLANCQIIPVDEQVALTAAALRVQYGSKLRTPDALHLATALTANADYFLTNDRALLKLPKPPIFIRSL